jgi:tRNA A37 threonylcarbamoyladenosine dehydratase
MFDRLELLIGKDKLDLIKTKNILVVGCGGVGGNAITSLIRSGIENITIVDFDKVDISNINRQEVAYLSTIGKSKVKELKEILLNINDKVKVNDLDLYLDESNIIELFDNNNFDYVIDACDNIKTKEAIIKECLDRDIKFISSCGTGNRLHPEMLEITSLSKTSGDPIARILRKWAKDNNINKKIMVLCSKEQPIRKGTVIASNSFVPPSAGLLITSYIINDIIK